MGGFVCTEACSSNQEDKNSEVTGETLRQLEDQSKSNK